MAQAQSIGKNLALVAILNLFFVLGAIYLSNFIFVTMAKIPMDVYGYNTIWQYHQVYGQINAVKQSIYISLGIGFLFVFLMNTIILVGLFGKKKRELHGSARFANNMEIRKTGFLPTIAQEKKLKNKFPSEPAIIIGKHKNKFLQFFGNEFVSIGAPTRSGKGVSIVIPNLLTYTDSVVVLDIKMENWNLTAGFRAKYQKVFLFAPRAEDGCSHCYNPLDYIDRDETRRMSDIQNIAGIFYQVEDPKDAFWQNQAQRIFTGLVLYMMETVSRPCTMSELIKLATPTGKPLHEWIPEIIEKRKKEPVVIDSKGETAIKKLSVECIEALMAYVNVDADSTRSSILASLLAPLNIFTDPMVATATSKSDFFLDEVRQKKMTIYVGIQPNELSRFSKLLNVLFSQLIDLNTRKLPEHDDRLKYQCLVLLDEFTALGRVDIIQKSIAYIAGYNIRLMPIFQSKSQVADAYGKDGANAIFSNIACQIEFTPTEQEQADEISKMLGTQTIKGKSISRNRGKGGGGSVSTSDQSRALMLPQELKEMSEDEQLIFFRRTKPIKCNKAFYYTNPEVFGSRMARLDRPAKGLDIPDKYKPPQLDVQATLKVMRGIQIEEVKTYKQLQDIKHYQENHIDFLDNLGASLGFDDEFLACMDSIDEQELIKYRSNTNEQNSLDVDDEDENDIIFDLSDTSEYDESFVDEFHF